MSICLQNKCIPALIFQLFSITEHDLIGQFYVAHRIRSRQSNGAVGLAGAGQRAPSQQSDAVSNGPFVSVVLIVEKPSLKSKIHEKET